MKTNINKEFTNTYGLNVLFYGTTGNINVENENEIIFSFYDDGNWDEIKIAIQTAINEHKETN